MGNLITKNMDDVCQDISNVYINHTDPHKRIVDLELLLVKYHNKRKQKFIKKCIIDLENHI